MKESSGVYYKLFKYCVLLNNSLVKNNIKDKEELLFAMIKDPDYHMAICGYVENIGEMTKHLSNEFKTRFNTVKYTRLYKTRNIFIHDYDSLATDLVAYIVFEDIQKLYFVLKEYINEI